MDFEPVLLVIHLLLALAIIGLVLMQRSEGGGLGIGGGSGGAAGNFATARGTANFLTKATAICAFAFFCTSLVLGVMAGGHSSSASVLDSLDEIPAVEKAMDEAVDIMPVDDGTVPEAPIAE